MKFSEVGLRKYIDLDKWGISSFGLKIIAMITMIIDHCGIVFTDEGSFLYLLMRSIGRLSFPIFCFLLVEGFYHTKNKMKHVVNLLVFALISEIPYDLFQNSLWSKQNVMFTLLVGFIVIWVYDERLYCVNSKTGKRYKKMNSTWLDSIIALGTILAAFAITYVINSTYSFAGVLLILLFYFADNKPLSRVFSNLFFNIGLYSKGIQWYGTLSSIIIEFYNGKPGRRKWKYFFYIFYPTHLLILAIIKNYIN